MSPEKKNTRNSQNKISVIFVSVLSAVLISTICFMLVLYFNQSDSTAAVPGSAASQEATVTEPSAPYITDTVTIGSAGDVLIHIPILNSAKESSGDYNFNGLFTYVSPVIKDCDYFVANLETTLGGTEDGRSYSGFPCFNSPDSIVSALKNAGVDCLLTANNHTYDTGTHGVKRTLSVVKGAGLDSVGTRSTEEEKKYLVKDIGSIKFGFACYTYETENENGTALNGILVNSETAKLINSFDYTDINGFYEEIGADLTAMKNEGAEITIVYLHWGNEYQVSADSHQQSIAQKLCDMGVDVIIGGHPHVVQPVDLITSTDGTHKTVCVYSVGNLISNQRRNLMGLKTGHTEDGLIFKMTFSKYSDGTVVFEKVKSIPTWVHLYSGNYNIVPLSKSLSDKATSLGLTKSSSGLSLAEESYSRTTALVQQGTKKCNRYLSSLSAPDTVTQATTDIAA